MGQYPKTELDIKVEELPFQDFLTSRYSMTVRVNAQKTYTYSKKNNIPFFNMTASCILEAINEIPEFKRRIIDGKVYEYEKINAISPIMQEDHSIREIEIPPLSELGSLEKYNEYIENKKKNIENNQFLVEPSLRDILPICNLSCIPWINFDSMTNIIASPNQLMPVIAWGKLVDGKIPISLTASHVFIFGYHFKLFYEKVEQYLEHPELLLNK
ncbi:CatA-like O-acetyltransferase [Methanosphaera sp. ISO3-F5]|uniref:CatA-like O-acetyltransferase n=1 Tax=Methanosphaera sp. ISO3-F5 TaxID=1452353 RepID=UPI002B25B68E|nr:CatA-like O-acetyltransferase [Methanosphaera sp. ISO3-F5]WQH65049.1 CatA-like O-acetyltransferase [Methanosphaera sp. ISO3-F5]